MGGCCGVERVAAGPLTVGRESKHLVRDGIIEEELCRELVLLIEAIEHPHFRMDVHRAPLIPARIDGHEL